MNINKEFKDIKMKAQQAAKEKAEAAKEKFKAGFNKIKMINSFSRGNTEAPPSAEEDIS